MTDTNAPVVIVGGLGTTGRRVAQRLSAKGIATRAASRSTPVPFDWTKPATWAPALTGATAAYVTFQPDLAVSGAAQVVGAFANTAREVGVDRIVLLSGRGEDGAAQSETALRASGLRSVVLRCNWFAQVFSEKFLRDGIVAGRLALPVGTVREPFVDADDIADVAVRALTEDRHLWRTYELTGPRALTFGEATAEIARTIGRPIKFESISHEAHAALLKAQGVPPDMQALLHDLFTTVLDGRNTRTTRDVERLLGHPPRDFAAYARQAAADGAWAIPETAA